MGRKDSEFGVLHIWFDVVMAALKDRPYTFIKPSRHILYLLRSLFLWTYCESLSLTKSMAQSIHSKTLKRLSTWTHVDQF